VKPPGVEGPLPGPFAPPAPEPTPPRRTMWADTTQLYLSAHTWERTIAGRLGSAAATVAAGRGGGDAFGLALAPLGTQFEQYVVAATTQLQVGSDVAAEMGTRLRRMADDWVRTDDGAAETTDRVRAVL
jgi:hypothetical protein